MVATADQHGAGKFWRFKQKFENAEIKTPKGGQKERPYREDHDGSAGYVKNFQQRAFMLFPVGAASGAQAKSLSH